MHNREYARILEEIATLQRVAGDNFFKVRAFSQAARLIEDFAEPLDDIIDQRRLDELQGIGESIEEELEALRKTGTSPRHQELLGRIGPGVFDLWEIPGLGLKRIQALYQQLGIASVDALKSAAKAGKLATVKGFGAAIEEKLLADIEGFERGRGRRFPLPQAKALAEEIRQQIAELPEVHRAEIGGSIRRGRETIGDIDILVTTDSPRSVSTFFKEMSDVVEVIFDGDTRASVRVTSEIQCDLRVIEPDLFGAGLHYFTGSKEHHIQMRLRSKKMGLKISEKGVTRYDDPAETPVGPMETEEQVFKAVGLAYIAPELRAGKGEIEAAENGTLPDLVDAARVAGDVHVFSKASGGNSTLEELVEGARGRGYRWLCVSERSRGVAGDRGLGGPELAARLDEIRKLNDELEDFRLIAGAEVAIDEDGMLDIDHGLLAECEWVIAGVHGASSADADELTQRMMWGLETGLVSCLAHPKGRRLGIDEGYDFYFEEVVGVCIDFGVVLEMCGEPSRLDLNATMARRARDLGASLVMGSGAGSASSLGYIDYALQQARRGWFEPVDLLNFGSAEVLLSTTRTLV